ncbi:integrase arm-type DNA-binding domain-containing protein [Bosea sp. TND4EK4]|uniref:tyrosine-type recombinase/integrase n=1 Tax=Bosea sp. TND4EK4 TaxID=1907408 RepID=UPI000953BE88|nr:integrase arm-type DNA-binding domain-containing protein [Bosea sp. TND4EK4]SIQ09951.1 Integrase [Bosea sp. TND4EK4]
MPLTNATIMNAKPGAGIVKRSDGEGLQLWIMPTGSKLWRFAYRFGGKQKLMALGSYPELSLADARDRRKAARALLAADRDPSEQKRLDKRAATTSSATTFALVANEVLEKKRREQKAVNTLAKLEWLHGLANESIGHRPITEISAPEILDVLKKVERKGRLETAKRLRAVIGEVFRYGVATARASGDPTSALRGAISAPVVKHRAAITDPVQLGGLMRAIASFQGQPSTVAALKLMAYLFPRPGELRFAEWREIDLENALWTIPSARMKMRKEHRVPLPPQALAILSELREITGGGKLVFPGYGTSGGEGRTVEQRPISENTLNGALRRMGYGQDDMSSHGFRAAASTLLNESGRFSSDAIERALAHQDPDAVRRAYARGEHWRERVTMAAWWADQLDAWRDGAKIVAMKAS